MLIYCKECTCRLEFCIHLSRCRMLDLRILGHMRLNISGQTCAAHWTSKKHLLKVSRTPPSRLGIKTRLAITLTTQRTRFASNAIEFKVLSVHSKHSLATGYPALSIRDIIGSYPGLQCATFRRNDNLPIPVHNCFVFKSKPAI